MAAKSSPPRQQKHFAVLIDANNTSAAIVEGLANYASVARPRDISGACCYYSQD